MNKRRRLVMTAFFIIAIASVTTLILIYFKQAENTAAGISKEESFEIAKKYAENNMHKMSPEYAPEYIFQENLSRSECRYNHVLKREVWEWELRYWYKGIDLSDEEAVKANEDNPDYSVPDYSCIVYVDRETGEILQMGTNWQ